jgi:hypothetical protein
MKRALCPVLVATIFSFAGMTLADDAPSAPPVKSHTQKMHDCMVEERANNSAMSEKDLKKTCAAKLQSDANHPSRPQPSPDLPHN